MLHGEFTTCAAADLGDYCDFGIRWDGGYEAGADYVAVDGQG